MKKIFSQATLIHLIASCGMLGYTKLSFAHEGALHVHTFTSGMLHPLLGLDHLAALALTGLWATLLVKDRRSIWLPVTFLAAMTLGLVAGGLHLSFSLLSADASLLLVLAMMPVLVMLRAPLPLCLVLVFVAGIAHGNAHGINTVAMSVPWFTGLLLMSAALHLAGWRMGVALGSQRWLSGGLGVMTVMVCARLVAGV